MVLGDWERAASLLEVADLEHDRVGAVTFAGYARAHRAVAAQRLGRVAEAHALIDDVVGTGERLGVAALASFALPA